MRDQGKAKPLEPETSEIQEGDGKSIARQEKLKKLIKQHPTRDAPRVDSVEPIEPSEPDEEPTR